jgi:predicted DNA-binding transcriptional regulator YafY
MRPPVGLSLALLKLRQLARHHVPPGVIGDFQEYLEGANRVLGMPPLDTRIRSAQAWIGKTARVEPGYPVLAPEIEDTVFDTVCAALYRDESLHITYRPADAPVGVVRDYVVLPYAIVEKAPFWYLVVSLRRSSGVQGDPFLLRMDRIASVEPRGYRMQRDASFDLTAFIRGEKIFEWFPEPPEQVVLRVTELNGVRSSFRAARLAHDQVITEEPGGFVLTATMTPSLALRNLLLENAPTVELLAPARIRTQIARELEAAARRYERKPSGPVHVDG